jgi:DNA-binding transcriptional MerR regulator
MPMTIGDLSDAAGVKVPTIRYYEQIGLLRVAARTRSNRRLYGQADVQRLAFIRHARELGFEIDAIRTLLTLQDDPAQPCRSADAIARARLGEVEARIAALRALKVELERMIEGCRHGRVADCRVIEVLADHGQCLHEHVRAAVNR